MPSMHPILFEIPGLGIPLRSFGLMVMLGFLAGAHFLTRWGVQGSPNPEKAQEGFGALPIWVLLGVIFGARFLYVGVEVAGNTPEGQHYKEDPLSIFYIWQGGLVMYGGALGGIIGGWLATRKHGLPVGQVMDLGVPAAFLGLAIGRIGCLLVGDDYGREVSAGHANWPFPLVVTVPDPLPEQSLFGAENIGKTLYCTQLWMSFNALGLFLIGRFLLLPRRRFAGQVAATLLLLYSGGRYFIEMYRGDKIRGLWFDDRFSTSQLISFGVAAICLLYLLLRFRRNESPEEIGGHAPGQTRSEGPDSEAGAEAS